MAEASVYLKLRVMEHLAKEMRSDEKRDQDKLFKESHMRWPQLGRVDFDEIYLLVLYVIQG